MSLQAFNVQDWLKAIDIWDEKYDYVMHNDHWLSTKWSPNCSQCQSKGKRPFSPVAEDSINANPPSYVVSGTISKSKPQQTQNNTLDMTNNEPTLRNDQHHNQHITQNNSTSNLSPPQPAPPHFVTPAITPILPKNNRMFVTPHTGGNICPTIQRSTRQSARNQTEVLIDLNETFDLYRSALAETPVAQTQPPPQNNATSKIPKIPIRLSRLLDQHE